MAKKTLRSAAADETQDHAAEAAPAAGANGVDADAPARKPRSRKAAPAADASSDALAAEAAPARSRRKAAEPTEASGDADAPKPRSRRKAADATPEATGEPAADAPKPRSRRKTAEASAETPAPPVADAATPAADEVPRPRRRTRVPREDQPVASSDNLPADTAGDAPPRDAAEAPPPRRRTRQIDLSTPRDNGPRDGGPRENAPRDDWRDEPRRDDARRDDRPRFDDEEGGGRRKRKRNRNKNKNRDGQPGGPPGSHPQGRPQGQPHGGQPYADYGPPQGGHPGEPFEGVLELIGDKKFGFVRGFSTSLVKGDNDPFMPPPLIQRYNLRDGVRVSGTIKPGRKGAMQVTEVTEVMGVSPDEWASVPDFDAGLVIYPEEKLNLVTGPEDVSMRVVDLVSPLGKGQRALIVAPPRAGKTILLKQIAAGLSANHPEVTLVALLIDERPEEVTDFRRNTAATVFASSNDAGEDNHVRVATLAFEYSRRLVEQGKDVVVLLDSLTRLGRTFNLFGGNMSGRTMSGGLDARALVMPRKIFGSARNIEDGGSLTIIATALVETGSRMDEVIFEEFKGTGNSEIVLDRELSEKRIYPAINIRKSGTRNEERLVPDELVRQRHMLLRALNSRFPVEAMQALVKQIQLSPTNVHLLNELVPETAY